MPLRCSAGSATRRRQWLAAGLGSAIGIKIAVAAAPLARAMAPDLRAAIDAFTAGAVVREGRVEIDVAPLVENGNAVPIAISVDSPMSDADHVVAIALFNERNPQRDVARFTLGPRAGRARIATRIRLATSQQLVAVARLSDGSHWSRSVDVIVTLAACIEE
ncbi:MAG: SoxY-related AACIE arm protein [Burkholderiaceae bacterium]